MKLLIDPPAPLWHPSNHANTPDRVWLAEVVRESASRMGTPLLDAKLPIIGTGHQAWFWHPGILAKDLVASSAARRIGAQPMHLVVDHDEHIGNTIDLPYREGDRVLVKTITLGPQDAATPTGCQPCWNPQSVIALLNNAQKELGNNRLVDLSGLIEAWQGVSKYSPANLAEQITAILFAIEPRTSAKLPIFLASDLSRADSFKSLVESILAAPNHCIAAYNAAAAQHPDAGIVPLRIESGRVEVPLWAVANGIQNGPRLRLFAKTNAPASSADFVLETGQPINRQTHRILPRALLLSAVMRRYFADLFIHGKGGAEYDQITDAWWSAWRAEPLNPRAVVSADLHMDFDFAPVATPKDLARAIWRKHHLAHNPDREPELIAALPYREMIDEKRQSLSTIKSAPDRHAKTRLFNRIHELNATMLNANPLLLPDADKAIQTARSGIVNQATTARRDWFFGFYSTAALDGMVREIENKIK